MVFGIKTELHCERMNHLLFLSSQWLWKIWTYNSSLHWQCVAYISRVKFLVLMFVNWGFRIVSALSFCELWFILPWVKLIYSMLWLWKKKQNENYHILTAFNTMLFSLPFLYLGCIFCWLPLLYIPGIFSDILWS